MSRSKPTRRLYCAKCKAKHFMAAVCGSPKHFNVTVTGRTESGAATCRCGTCADLSRSIAPKKRTVIARRRVMRSTDSEQTMHRELIPGVVANVSPTASPETLAALTNMAGLARPGQPPLRYTDVDSDRAEKEWKATCGPHSIAAALGKTLDEVRPALANYKGWMSPTQMTQALLKLGAFHNLTHHLKTPNLCHGINRVQWEGKWLNPGVPARVAYFHTHWVARFGDWVLCTACEPAKWIPEWEWRHFHVNCEPKSPFHITHHYALPRPT